MNWKPMLATKLPSQGGVGGTGIESRNRDPISALLPLPVRHERGEGWGEGKVNKDGPPLPDPLLPSEGKRGGRGSGTCFFRFLNSMAVGFRGAMRLKMSGSSHTGPLPIRRGVCLAECARPWAQQRWNMTWPSKLSMRAASSASCGLCCGECILIAVC